MSDTHVLVYGRCISCDRPMTFSPDYVPSIRVPPTNEREPLCPTCFATWNRIHRTDKGLQPLPLHPLAYEAQQIDG